MIPRQARDLYCQGQLHDLERSALAVHMMLEKTLYHLKLVKVGIREKNRKKKNRHLAKAIAVVTELSSSVKITDGSDAARFLRSIYGSILKGLDILAQENDIQVLEKLYDSLQRLHKMLLRMSLCYENVETW